MERPSCSSTQNNKPQLGTGKIGLGGVKGVGGRPQNGCKHAGWDTPSAAGSLRPSPGFRVVTEQPIRGAASSARGLFPEKHGSQGGSSPQIWGQPGVGSPTTPLIPRGGEDMQRFDLKRFYQPNETSLRFQAAGERVPRCFGGARSLFTKPRAQVGCRQCPPTLWVHGKLQQTRWGASTPPKTGGQGLPQRSQTGRETMSDSEFQHIIGRVIIKRGFDALTHGASPPPHLPRAEQPLPFFPAYKGASTKGHGRGRIENWDNKKPPVRLLNLSEQEKAAVLFTLPGTPSPLQKVALGRP